MGREQFRKKCKPVHPAPSAQSLILSIASSRIATRCPQTPCAKRHSPCNTQNHKNKNFFPIPRSITHISPIWCAKRAASAQPRAKYGGTIMCRKTQAPFHTAPPAAARDKLHVLLQLPTPSRPTPPGTRRAPTNAKQCQPAPQNAPAQNELQSGQSTIAPAPLYFQTKPPTPISTPKTQSNRPPRNKQTHFRKTNPTRPVRLIFTPNKTIIRSRANKRR